MNWLTIPFTIQNYYSMLSLEYWNDVTLYLKPYIPKQNYHVRFSIQPLGKHKYDLKSWLKKLDTIEDLILDEFITANITDVYYHGITYKGYEILDGNNDHEDCARPLIPNRYESDFTTDIYFMSASGSTKEEIAKSLLKIRCLFFAQGLKMVHWVIHNSS
jgi:hypothetical protein